MNNSQLPSSLYLNQTDYWILLATISSYTLFHVFTDQNDSCQPHALALSFSLLLAVLQSLDGDLDLDNNQECISVAGRVSFCFLIIVSITRALSKVADSEVSHLIVKANRILDLWAQKELVGIFLSFSFTHQLMVSSDQKHFGPPLVLLLTMFSWLDTISTYC
jgi:hypothetical protein